MSTVFFQQLGCNFPEKIHMQDLCPLSPLTPLTTKLLHPVYHFQTLLLPPELDHTTGCKKLKAKSLSLQGDLQRGQRKMSLIAQKLLDLYNVCLEIAQYWSATCGKCLQVVLLHFKGSQLLPPTVQPATAQPVQAPPRLTGTSLRKLSNSAINTTVPLHPR